LGVGAVDERGLGVSETEVEELDVAVPGEEDVLGLDVAMDDAAIVGGGEGVGGLATNLEGALREDGAARDRDCPSEEPGSAASSS
jgi:hypothetical protein